MPYRARIVINGFTVHTEEIPYQDMMFLVDSAKDNTDVTVGREARSIGSDNWNDLDADYSVRETHKKIITPKDVAASIARVHASA